MSGSDLGADAHRASWARWSSIAALALGVGAAVAWNLSRPRVVHAAVVGASADADGDGLPNTLEHALGTDPYLVDSDADGISDSEEFARHSSPSKSWDTPGSATASIGMGITLEGVSLRTVTVIYLADGDLNSKVLKLGLVSKGLPVYLPKVVMGSVSNLTIVPASIPGQLVAVYDCPISPAVLRATGSASLFSILTGPGGVKVADAVNISRLSGAICQRFVLTTQTGGSPGMTMQVAGPISGGTVFRPIGGSSPPATWTPGEICNQGTQLVGYSGGASVQEVVSANCESGWDAFCDPSCAASVGSTITILDPAVLVGG